MNRSSALRAEQCAKAPWRIMEQQWRCCFMKEENWLAPQSEWGIHKTLQKN
jgi:hypothetical protein